jgi:hypothetical protein
LNGIRSITGVERFSISGGISPQYFGLVHALRGVFEYRTRAGDVHRKIQVALEIVEDLLPPFVTYLYAVSSAAWMNRNIDSHGLAGL